MSTGKLTIIAILAASLVLPACRDSTPVEAKAAEAAATGPTFSTSSSRPVFQTRVHDDYASYYASTWDGNSSRYMSVWAGRAGPGPDAPAWLSIYGGECTQSGPEWWDYVCTYFYGGGMIPARDVSGGFRSGLSVHTDLRGNPNFWLWGADPGIVSIRWERTGWSERSTSGSEESRWGHYIVRQSGVRRSSSATATGEVLGISLPEGGWGDIQTGRGVTLQFERIPNN